MVIPSLNGTYQAMSLINIDISNYGSVIDPIILLQFYNHHTSMSEVWKSISDNDDKSHKSIIIIDKQHIMQEASVVWNTNGLESSGGGYLICAAMLVIMESLLHHLIEKSWNEWKYHKFY